MQMVVVLAGNVEHGRILAERTLDDLLQGLAFEFSPLDRVVSVGYVSLVMLVVVVFQRFLGHVGRKGVSGNRADMGSEQGHGEMSRLMGDVSGSNGNHYRTVPLAHKTPQLGKNGELRVTPSASAYDGTAAELLSAKASLLCV
jgi:hypothetical protein